MPSDDRARRRLMLSASLPCPVDLQEGDRFLFQGEAIVEKVEPNARNGGDTPVRKQTAKVIGVEILRVRSRPDPLKEDA